MATKLEEMLASLSEEEKAELRTQFAPSGDPDPYRDSILKDAMNMWQKQYGPIVGNVAAHTAMSKLTEGLTVKAAEMLREQFKDKPVDHILALANHPVYSGLFRGAAEAHVVKEEAEAEAAKVAAEAEAGIAPEGRQKAPATSDMEEFRREVGSIMVDGKPLEFTDDEVKDILDDSKLAGGQVVT